MESAVDEQCEANQKSDTLFALVPPEHVAAILSSQRNMLARFEKTNEMLVNCNSLAGERLERASRDLKIHIQTLEELKNDLANIFKRVRILKSRLKQSQPEAFEACTLPSPTSAQVNDKEL